MVYPEVCRLSRYIHMMHAPAFYVSKSVHWDLFQAFTDQEDEASKNRFRLLRHESRRCPGRRRMVQSPN